MSEVVTTATEEPRRTAGDIKREYHWMLTQAVINGWKVKCLDDPDPFVEFEPEDAPTRAEAKELCAGCPMLKLCGQEARITKPFHGVRAGIVWVEGRQWAEPTPDSVLDTPDLATIVA